MSKARSSHEALQWRGGKHKARSEGFVSGVSVQQGMMGRSPEQAPRPARAAVVEEEGARITVSPIEPPKDERTRPSGRIKLG